MFLHFLLVLQSALLVGGTNFTVDFNLLCPLEKRVAFEYKVDLCEVNGWSPAQIVGKTAGNGLSGRNTSSSVSGELESDHPFNSEWEIKINIKHNCTGGEETICERILGGSCSHEKAECAFDVTRTLETNPIRSSCNPEESSVCGWTA